MVRVFVFLAAVQVVLMVLALISCLSAERVRALPRALWVLVILLIPLLGPVAYFVAGRPPAARPSRATAVPGPAAPDDDPDFLRSLNAEQARKDREMLAELERQLKDADDDTRRRDEPPRRRADDEARRKDDEARRRDNEETPPTEV